jgi:serine/threonine protein kinase
VAKSANDIEYLKREFRMWLGLPYNYNVLTALGFDIARLSDRDNAQTVSLPVMRMKRMGGSLDDWIEGTVNPGIADRVIALAQAFNGLQFLYTHGIQGHGDLKPSNILYSNLNNSTELPADGWPSVEHPWLVRIADLGWADAWVDLGFTNKALRQYLAPERLDNSFVPGQSDVFAMGIIAAEVLQGRHPAPNRKVTKSEGEWRKWITGGKWDLERVSSNSLREMIRRCLDPDPGKRPTPEECLEDICRELEISHGIAVGPTLSVWRNPQSVIEDIEHAASANVRSADLGPTQALQLRLDLAQRLASVYVIDFESSEAWVTLAEPLLQLLEREGQVASLERETLRADAKRHLRSVISAIDPNDPETVRKREDWPQSVQPFERFASVVGRMTAIAGLDYENTPMGGDSMGPLALSALAFSLASSVQSVEGDGSAEGRLLSEAISLSPNVAVPYYFRALWGHERWFLQKTLAGGSIHPTEYQVRLWVADLEIATRLAPEWEEPLALLKQVRDQFA